MNPSVVCRLSLKQSVCLCAVISLQLFASLKMKFKKNKTFEEPATICFILIYFGRFCAVAGGKDLSEVFFSFTTVCLILKGSWNTAFIVPVTQDGTVNQAVFLDVCDVV